MNLHHLCQFTVKLVPCALLGACAPKPVPQWMMPTPQLFLDGKVRPFVHLPAKDRTPPVQIHYATNRNSQGDHYGNAPGGQLRFGSATMLLGDKDENWESLVEASTTHPRRKPIQITLQSSSETGAAADPASAGQWARNVNRDLLGTETREIIVYVHGAKVGFLHSCAFVAELDHFSGRDFAPVTFDWPTHPDIFSYVDRVDLAHTVPSATRLAEMLRLLADETSARRIHIVSWSAGARVVSRALAQIGGNDPAAVRSRYRLGTVVFAAGDLPEDLFIQRLPAVYGLTERVLVYLSDDDYALKWASRAMGGKRRLGLAPKQLTEEERKILHDMPRLEVVDTSYGKDLRGFDITGHRYWFQHPWVNSDLILALRTRAKPAERGLKPAPSPGIWYFGEDYSNHIGAVGRRLTDGQW